MKNENSKLLSIILFSYFSNERLNTTSGKIIRRMEEEHIPFELIIIDDGSTDNSFDIACELAKKDERIFAFQLSRNYTTNYAKFAGLKVCNGACSVFVPDDLQRPLNTVVQMYRLWEQGNKIVIDYRVSRNDGRISDAFSNFYYKIMNNFSMVNFPPGGTDGFLADREVIDVINERIKPTNTSIVVEVLRLGYSPIFIPSERPTANHISRWTFRKKVKLAADTFFASSSFPIKAITYIGFITFFSCFLVSIALIFAKLSLDNRLFGLRIPGWTTTVVIITMFNGLILLCMGIVAEYIWRIYEEVKERPAYLIRKNTDKEIGEY